jgi:hypothetical protein
MAKLSPEQAAKNRERQRKWRERAFKDPDGHLLTRVNVALGSHAAASLKRLSEGYSLTHRELFERLLIAANMAVIESLMGKGAWRFEDGKLEPGALGAFDLAVRREPLADNAVETASETLQPNDMVNAEALPDNAPALALEPSAPPPKAKDYPDWLKAKAVAMHRAGESRETIRAMLVEAFGKAPDPSNWTKTLRRWEGIGTAGIAGL